MGVETVAARGAAIAWWLKLMFTRGPSAALGFLHSTVFDSRGQASATVDPLGFRTSSVFSATGQVLAGVDALGNRTSSVYDGAGRQTASQSALGNLTTSVFDAVGQQIALVDGNSHRTTSLFNGRGDLLSTQDALGAFTSWQYDAAGNTSLRTDARNWPTSYTVDTLNRTTGQVYIDGTRVTNTFDAGECAPRSGGKRRGPDPGRPKGIQRSNSLRRDRSRPSRPRSHELRFLANHLQHARPQPN